MDANRNADGSLEEIHPLNGKKHEDIQKATLKNTKMLEKTGYMFQRIRECEWKKLKKGTEVPSYIKILKSVVPYYQLSFERI